ncbi:hypothetical protein [Neobacillus vireti]|uniref:hypothetical protein n=1 Tax=Neobacillus vireti TaxID=220686 RepID=UPI002FFF464B
MSCRTDDNGLVSIEGFLGEYELVCEDKKVSFQLEKDAEAVQTVNLIKTNILV